MKKTLKLLSVAAMLFTATAMSGCNKSVDPSKCAHNYVEVTEESVAATCSAAGKKVTKCDKCGDKKEQTISKKSHAYEKVAAESTDAVCGTAGKLVEKCKNCDAKRETELDALEHDFQDAADQTGAVAATCTADGTKITECANCHTKSTATVRATGHTYENDADQTGATAPTCTTPGTIKQTCAVCGDKHDEEKAALGHTFGEGTTTAKAGDNVALTKAECSVDHAVRYSWEAKDVTAGTLSEANMRVVGDFKEPNVVIAEDGGTQFWGRPKGNAVVLDENGGASQDSHEAVYDATVKGSYMEYSVNLPEAITGYKLVADINPAQWLDANGGMFVAAPNGDWTPGMTAADTPVSDFRYIVEIDGTAVALDAAKNVGGSGRAWYDFPVAEPINLTAGTHTIKLTMTGGWKHTFYAFGLQAA